MAKLPNLGHNFGGKNSSQGVCRLPRDQNRQKMVEEKIRSQFKKFTRKIKGDKKVKHNSAVLAAEFNLQKSNIARQMQGRMPKVPNFAALSKPHVKQIPLRRVN